MNASRLALLSLGALQISLAAASAAPITIYDGNGSPTTQGWHHNSDGVNTATTNAGVTEFNSTTGSSNISVYKYATGVSEFIVSIRLQVFEAVNNSYDSALGFSAAANPNLSQFTPDRDNTLEINQGSLRWSDNIGPTYAMDTTSGFHEYALRYQGGQLDVFVDATFDAIIAGTATAVLSRSNPVFFWTLLPGYIAFGDSTNDNGANSRYAVDFVNFQDLTPAAPVPEPGTITLLGLGIAGLAARRKRRAAKVD